MAPMPKLMGPRPLYYKTIYSKPMKLHLYRPPRPKPKPPNWLMVSIDTFSYAMAPHGAKATTQTTCRQQKKMARFPPFIRVRNLCQLKTAYERPRRTYKPWAPPTALRGACEVAEDHDHVLSHMTRHPLLQHRSKAAAEDRRRRQLRSFQRRACERRHKRGRSKDSRQQ